MATARSRRSSSEIVCNVLEVCAQGETSKTSIMYRCNLSYKQLQRYLSYLVASELVAHNANGYYCLTERGWEMWEKLLELTRFLNDVLVPRH